jgi:dTDP-4-amino-4,6-dideoxygalactose transaminase
MIIPFSPPRIDQNVIEEVTKALQSGWITTGPRTKLFEKKIAKYCNVTDVLAVNSWTAGAELLLYWYDIKEGDEVIVPVYTYCATANIVRHRGATVIMVDVTSDFGIDISKIEKHITSRTKAVIPVDVGGLPIDYSALNQLLQQQNVKELFVPESENQQKLGRILVLSDAAHSFGAVYHNEKVGAQADFTVFSFHAVKNLTTAEGGAICINLPTPFNNKEVYDRLNTLSLHGQDKDALAKSQKGNWEYDVIDAGFKCNMTDILASIGLVEFDRYETETLPKRKSIFEKYTTALEKFDWAITPIYADEVRETSYHLYLLRIKGVTLEERNNIIQEIFNHDVSVNVHYKPLPLLSYYKALEYNMDDYPVAKKLWETEISLPVFYELTEKQINRVIEVVVKSVNKILVYNEAII